MYRISLIICFLIIIFSCQSLEKKEERMTKLWSNVELTHKEMQNLKTERTEYFNGIYKKLDPKYHSTFRSMMNRMGGSLNLEEEGIEGLNDVFELGANLVGLFEDKSLKEETEKLTAKDVEVLKSYKKRYIVLSEDLYENLEISYEFLLKNEKLYNTEKRMNFLDAHEKMLGKGKYANKKKPSLWSLFDGVSSGKNGISKGRKKYYVCTTCNGEGRIYDGQWGEYFECSHCNGSGEVIGY